MFKDAAWLAKKELIYQWRAGMGTLIATVFIGVFFGFFMAGLVKMRIEEYTDIFQFVFLDLIFVGVAPSFGTFYMARPYLSYKDAKLDPYVKRMAVLRSLPIPVSILASSRIILMVITLTVMSVAFYGSIGTVIYIFGSSFSYLTFEQFLIFGFVWFGFALAAGGLNPFIEYGTNGRMIHFFPFIYVALFVVIELLLIFNSGPSIVEFSFTLVKEYGWLTAVISLLIGFLSLFGWKKLLKGRLEKRDYL